MRCTGTRGGCCCCLLLLSPPSPSRVLRLCQTGGEGPAGTGGVSACTRSLMHTQQQRRGELSVPPAPPPFFQADV